MTGKLYLCATPIGNLEDITYRVLKTLKEADLIAAEDTRHSIKLLNHFDIKTPMTSYHEYNKVEKAKYKQVFRSLHFQDLQPVSPPLPCPGFQPESAVLRHFCLKKKVKKKNASGSWKN